MRKLIPFFSQIFQQTSINVSRDCDQQIYLFYHHFKFDKNERSTNTMHQNVL